VDKIIFDEVYFGARKAHYTNYLELMNQSETQKEYDKFLNKHDLKKDSICELGAGIGQLAKQARNPNWLCIDSSSWCNENRVWDNFLCRDAFEMLRSFPDLHFDYIISFSFLECLMDGQVKEIIQLMNKKSKNQIHGVTKTGNTQFYNIKTLEQWKVFFKPDVEVFFIG